MRQAAKEQAAAANEFRRAGKVFIVGALLFAVVLTIGLITRSSSIESNCEAINEVKAQLVMNYAADRDASLKQLNQLAKQKGQILPGFPNTLLRQNTTDRYRRSVQGLDPSSC